MTMEGFVAFEDGIMKTICHVYQHEDGRTLHLLPILHIGEKKYYNDLMEYVGDKICVFEEMKFGIEGQEVEIDENYVSPKTLNEWIAHNETQANATDANYGKEVKKFVKKILIRDIRKLRRVVKANLSRVDKRITQIFHQCERTAFSLTNLPIIQTALADIMGLTFQFGEIDYLKDIPRRKNWVHADIDFKLPVDFDIKKMFSSPSPEIIKTSRSNTRVLLGLLYLIESFVFMDLNQRRTELAVLLAPTIGDTPDVGSIAPHLVQPRNNIVIEEADKLFDEHDEVVVFYGAGHMPGIKEAALNSNFKLISTTEFEVYRLVKDSELVSE